MRRKLILNLLLLSGVCLATAQVKDRERPKEWEQLVPGARFMDRFVAMPTGNLTSDVWGTDCVKPRYVNNGIEDSERSYWGGNILQGEDGKFHLFVCGWPENSPKGHMFWPQSTVYHTVSDQLNGPYAIVDTIGKGHNPEAFRLKDGRYVVYVIDGYYLANTMNGPWERRKFDFDRRDRRIIEGLTNLSFAAREDGSKLMVCRGGGIWISKTGLSPYMQITDKRVYPPVEGEFEDPVIWRDSVQYHLIVNDWLGRIAFYLRSKDGVNWVTDPGEAYLPGIAFHTDGQKEDWFKYERIKIFQDEYGRAVQANFAVIDTLKHEDLPNDNHSSKNICLPLNPGLLISMLDAAPITRETETIRLRIQAEPTFNPQKDLDIKSLRFGASKEVNFGRGAKVKTVQNDGADLIVTFYADGNGITSEEFAPKLIGKTKKGAMVFGFTRLPYVDYTPTIVSARMPRFTLQANGTVGDVEIENFGLKPVTKSVMELYLVENGKKHLFAEADVDALDPYQRTIANFKTSKILKPSTEYSFELVLKNNDKILSTYTFQTIPEL